MTSSPQASWSAEWLASLAVLALCLSAPATAEAQPVASKEYKIKAVFLYHFLHFVDWPLEAFADPDSPYVVGVLGHDPFGKALDETMADKTVKGRRIVVERYAAVQEIKTCHLLFISTSEKLKMKSVLTHLKDQPVLTVGETENFAAERGAIQFLIRSDRVRLRINLEAAQAAGLNISSKLLRQAELTGSKRPR